MSFLNVISMMSHSKDDLHHKGGGRWTWNTAMNTGGKTPALVMNLGTCCKMPQYRLTDILYANNNMLHCANSLNVIHVMIT